jgi:hypothetical protein
MDAEALLAIVWIVQDASIHLLKVVGLVVC